MVIQKFFLANIFCSKIGGYSGGQELRGWVKEGIFKQKEEEKKKNIMEDLKHT